MQVVIVEITEEDVRQIVGSSNYELALREEAEKTERGRWLLNHCQQMEIKHFYDTIEEHSFVIALLGYLPHDVFRIEYMLKF